MKKGYFYIANKKGNGRRAGLVFVLNIGNGKLLKLSTLKYIHKDNSILVVFTPITSSDAVDLEKHMKKESIYSKKRFDNQICKLSERLFPACLDRI